RAGQQQGRVVARALRQVGGAGPRAERLQGRRVRRAADPLVVLRAADLDALAAPRVHLPGLGRFPVPTRHETPGPPQPAWMRPKPTAPARPRLTTQPGGRLRPSSEARAPASKLGLVARNPGVRNPVLSAEDEVIDRGRRAAAAAASVGSAPGPV